MKKVTNGNGLYAIRWGIWPLYRYLDLRHREFWWSKTSMYYMDCWGSREKVDEWYGLLNPEEVEDE